MTTLEKVYVLQTMTLGYAVSGSGGSVKNPAGPKTRRAPLLLFASTAAAAGACACGVML